MALILEIELVSDLADFMHERNVDHDDSPTGYGRDCATCKDLAEHVLCYLMAQGRMANRQCWCTANFICEKHRLERLQEQLGVTA